jgi:hypothetical protein
MKSKFLLIGGLCVASVMTACHNNNDGSSTTPPPTATPPPTMSGMALDTAQVLALAQVTSETSSPIAVNGGALTLSDSSETTAPISVQ